MSRQEINLTFVVVAAHIAVILGSTCDLRYFQHYEQKSCEPVLGSDGCPVRYRCGTLSKDERKTCIHKGKVYKDRDPIQGLAVCNSCTCEVDKRGSASIECASVDCPDWDTKNKSCYMGYKPEECCPREICPGEKSEDRKTCSHGGKNYRIGESISVSDPCKSCICTERWTGENGFGCSPVDCLLGTYADSIRNGCLPVYRENGCCPLEVDCGGIFGATAIDVIGKDNDHYCHYQGRYYERGSTAYLSSDKHQCTTCKCSYPPDFTCVRKACPSRPRPDCKAVYGRCCPAYECP